MESKRRRLIEDDLAFLPPEIITEILSSLPADLAITCRCICKQWRSLIDHPSFIESHTRQVISSSSSSTSNPKQFGNTSSSFGFFLCAVIENRGFHLQFVKYIDHGEDLVPEFKPCKPITQNPFPFYINWGDLIFSTCNGLVLMGSTVPNHVNDIFVCNPFTREYVNLSTVPAAATTTDENDAEERQRAFLRERKRFRAYGFGYLPSTNEYKIVSIYYHDLNGAKGEVSLYTIGSGRWRNKGEITYCVYNDHHPGFFVNGAIHWIGKMEIVTFDLANKKFKVVVPLPPPRALSGPYFDDELGVLGGCLCVSRETRSDKRTYIKDIWALNVNNKDAEEEREEFSWNKRFSIQLKGITWAEPHVILKSGKILLGSDYSFISYDPKTGAFDEDKNLSVFYDYRHQVIPYTKSFVSLKSLGEEDAKCFGGGFVPIPLHNHRTNNNRGNCFGAGHTRTI